MHFKHRVQYGDKEVKGSLLFIQIEVNIETLLKDERRITNDTQAVAKRLKKRGGGGGCHIKSADNIRMRMPTRNQCPF